MKKIAYLDNDIIVTSTLLDDTVEIDFDYVDITNVDIDCIDACYIEDGEIKIDQQKLIEFNRKNMPTLTAIEFDIKLNNAGLYDVVQELIKDKFELRIAYNRATFFSRTDPFIDQARIALGLTDEQVDEIWRNKKTPRKRFGLILGKSDIIGKTDVERTNADF